ncbi:hypothetical protein P8605_04845 [Streptomyces sp. T-3]|nr:hypothetical protein [Streptomyces sp. T-3]
MSKIASHLLITSVSSWTWAEQTLGGPAAFILLAPPLTPDTVIDDARQQMLMLAEALKLAAPFEPLPDIGHRVTLAGDRLAHLHLDGTHEVIALNVGPVWVKYARESAPVMVLLGLVPLATESDQDHTELYLRSNVARQRMRMGRASLRRA